MMSQAQILQILRKAGRPMTREEVEPYCDCNKNSVCRKLNRLARSGFIEVIKGAQQFDVKYEANNKTKRHG